MLETRLLDRDELAAADWARGGVALERRAASSPPAAPAAEATRSAWLPRFGPVMSEQLRTVGMSLRRELAALLGLATVSILSMAMRFPGRAAVGLDPEILAPAVLLGVLMPLAVWKSEGPGRRGYLRTLPVDHGRHALAKSFAGWVWLMAAIGAYLGWALMMAAGTGGGLEYVGWRWMAPIAGATLLYTLGTALSLVARHPWRWLAGAVVGYVAINTLSNAMPALLPLRELIDWLLDGPIGLARVITGLDGGYGWSGTIRFLSWLALTGAWLGAAGAALLAAVHRMPEE